MCSTTCRLRRSKSWLWVRPIQMPGLTLHNNTLWCHRNPFASCGKWRKIWGSLRSSVIGSAPPPAAAIWSLTVRNLSSQIWGTARPTTRPGSWRSEWNVLFCGWWRAGWFGCAVLHWWLTEGKFRPISRNQQEGNPKNQQSLRKSQQFDGIYQEVRVIGAMLEYGRCLGQCNFSLSCLSPKLVDLHWQGPSNVRPQQWSNQMRFGDTDARRSQIYHPSAEGLEDKCSGAWHIPRVENHGKPNYI